MINDPIYEFDRRLAKGLLLCAGACLVVANALSAFDVPYFPFRFVLIVTSAVIMFGVVFWVVAKFRADPSALKVLLLATLLMALALALQTDVLADIGRRITRLPPRAFQNLALDTPAEVALCLIVWITVSAYIVASHERRQAIERADALSQTQSALQVSESKFRKLAESTAASLFIHQDGKIQYVNPPALKNTGFTLDELLGKTIWDLVPAHARDFAIENAIARQRGEGAPDRYELPIIVKDGSQHWVDLTAILIETESGPAVLGTAFDVTERKQAEGELLAKQQLLLQLITAHDRERRLVAYEIHDGVAQELSTALMRLESVDLHRALSEKDIESCEVSLQLLRRAVQEVRNLIGGLRPPILEEQGITAAIEYLVQETGSGNRVQISFEHNISQSKLSSLVEGNIFRIVQEALTNVRQHSGAEKAKIDLSQHGDRVQLEIRDWGVGFDPATIQENRFGLRGIRDRADALNGQATIDSAPGDGTRVFVDLPTMADWD